MSHYSFFIRTRIRTDLHGFSLTFEALLSWVKKPKNIRAIRVYLCPCFELGEVIEDLQPVQRLQYWLLLQRYLQIFQSW
jgi:hypothetical protein